MSRTRVERLERRHEFFTVAPATQQQPEKRDGPAHLRRAFPSRGPGRARFVHPSPRVWVSL